MRAFFIATTFLFTACSSAATGEVDIGPDPETVATTEQHADPPDQTPAPMASSSAPATPQGGPAPSGPVCVKGACVPWVPAGYRWNGVCFLPLTETCPCVPDGQDTPPCHSECFVGDDGVTVQPVYCTDSDGAKWTWPHGPFTPDGRRVD